MRYVPDTGAFGNYVYDSLVAMLDRYMHDTAYINRYILDSLVGYIDAYLPDTVFRTDTLTEYVNIYVHDTVYIHDTVYVDLQGTVEALPVEARLYQRGGSLVVESGSGEPLPEVKLYDAVGRLLERKVAAGATVAVIDVPVSGAYLVSIGDAPARRVVVVR